MPRKPGAESPCLLSAVQPGYWVQNPGPLQERSTLLTAESSLQLWKCHLKCSPLTIRWASMSKAS